MGPSWTEYLSVKDVKLSDLLVEELHGPGPDVPRLDGAASSSQSVAPLLTHSDAAQCGRC